MCKILTLFVLWTPAFFLDPVHQNITGLQSRCLWLYLLWGCTVLVLLMRRLAPGPWLWLLGAGFLIPWRLQGPGWMNDLHVWLQIAGITLLSVSQMRLLVYTGEKKARMYFLVLGTSFAVMGVCSHVSGLAEMIWASGILLLIPVRQVQTGKKQHAETRSRKF